MTGAASSSSSSSVGTAAAAGLGFARGFLGPAAAFTRDGGGGGGDELTSSRRDRDGLDEPGAGAHRFAAAARRFLGGENVGTELEAAAAAGRERLGGERTCTTSSSLLVAGLPRRRLPAAAAGVDATIAMSLSVDETMRETATRPRATRLAREERDDVQQDSAPAGDGGLVVGRALGDGHCERLEALVRGDPARKRPIRAAQLHLAVLVPPRAGLERGVACVLTDHVRAARATLRRTRQDLVEWPRSLEAGRLC